MDARATLIREAIRFADWAAGQGICPAEGEPARAPEDFLYDYSNATDDTEWETLAERISAQIPPAADEPERARMRRQAGVAPGA